MEWLQTILNFLFSGEGITLIAVLNLLLGLIMKQWLTEAWLENAKQKVRVFFRWVGTVITLGLPRYPVTRVIWNYLVEPILILLIDVLWNQIGLGLKEGFLSDEPTTNDQTKTMKKAYRIEEYRPK